MLCTAASVLAALIGVPPATGPRVEEMEEARLFVASVFEGRVETRMAGVGLEVLANHGVVQQNARGDRPLRIGKREFTHGLYCHAPSEIIVRLPGPARPFAATIGVDSNSQTISGHGSVVFRVRVAGAEVFAGDVMREGAAPTDVGVDLAGADGFTLAISDAGDGISHDQGDWAEARVEFEDGSVIRLGDMPLFDSRLAPWLTDPPFSFVYNGHPSAKLLLTWPLVRESRPLDDARTEHVLTWVDPQTGLVVRCVGVAYSDFPTVEWTLWLRNGGQADTPIISDIKALDLPLTRDLGSEFVLHHNIGSPCTPTDYEPFSDTLEAGTTRRITTSGGRPTNSDLPYFCLEQPGGGLIVVIGWPGQWAAEFVRDGDLGLRVCGGQELTHFRLRPGEEARGPLIALQFYKGDRLRAQNTWRRFMLAHNTPRPSGRALTPMLAAVSGNHFPGLLCDYEGELQFLTRLKEERIDFDVWWMDAGWYPNTGSWPSTGTWEVDTERFPGGLRAISDWVHAEDMELLVWFEPERVTPGTWLYETHPEWLLGPDGGTKLLNLGNEEARRWLTDHVDGLMAEQGIDHYRQDFNMDPLPYWRANDAEDRQGITEIGHVSGYLAFWDELRRRRPDMLIDSCASGGRRNDLETLRRAVPLLRSDFVFDPVANQCHTYGLAPWMPYHGTGFIDYDHYLLRSCTTPWFTIGPDMRRADLDCDLLRALLDEWRELAPYLLGDFYPLTSYSAALDAWMAWQFDRPDLGAGIVQVFRRHESIYEVARLLLHGLDREALYTFRDLDTGHMMQMTGEAAMSEGVRIEASNRPQAVILVYEKEASP